jgi:chromosome segregation ATPase
LKRIGELQANLAEERHKSEALDATSNKLFEAEESLIKAREEIDSLQSELEEVRVRRQALEEEKALSAKFADSLQQQIEGASVENAEKAKTIDQLKEEISRVTSEHEVVKREAEESKAKSTEDCGQKDAQIEKLKAELDNQKTLMEKLERTNADLVKENDKLKMQLSAKSIDAETVNEQVAEKEKEIKSLRDELDTVKKELGHKVEDLERHKDNSHEVEGSLRKELDQTRDNLKSKISEVENVKKELNVQISQKDKQIEEANKKIAQNSDELKKLNDELTATKSSFEESKNEIHSRHARQVASQDSQLMALSAEIQQKNEEITRSQIVISKLEEDLCSKNGVIEKLRLELESFEHQQSSHTEASTILTKKMNELTLSHGDVQRQLNAANERITGLLELKQRLEAEIQSLTAKCENAAQLEQLRSEIQAKETLLESLKAEYEQKLQNSERARHEIELHHEEDVANFERAKSELETRLRITTQSEELLQQRCDGTIAEMAKIRDEHRVRISELEHSLQEKELALGNLQSKCSESGRYYQEQMKTATEEMSRNLESSQQKLAALTEEVLQLKQNLAEKSEALIEANAESSHILAQNQQAVSELKQQYGEDIRKLEFELNEKNMQLEKRSTELQLLKSDCQNSSTDLEGKDQKIGELTAEVQQAQNLITQLQEDLTSAQLLYQQTVNEHETVQTQCKGLLEQVASLSEKVQTGESLFDNLQIEHDTAMNVMDRLRITEQQKQECLQQLQLEATSSAQTKNCQHVMELLNQIKVDNSTEATEKILGLQKEVEVVRNQLAERNHQLDVQKAELLRLQEDLVKVRDSVDFVLKVQVVCLQVQEGSSECAEGQRDQNSVSLNDTHNTPHNTLHASLSSNPVELQVQLTMLKQSYTQLSARFETLRKENNYLLARLQNALNNGNGHVVNELVQRLGQNNRDYKALKNSLQLDNFNLQKTLQYSILRLQEKERVANDQKVEIKNLLQMMRNLPVQCKSFATLKETGLKTNECAGLNVDIKRVKDLLNMKEAQVQQLQKQMSVFLNEYGYQKSQKTICIQQPCICQDSQQEVKKVQVVTPSSPKIVRVMVPVIQPKIVVKEVKVPVLNGTRCPGLKIERIEVPKVVIQKVPMDIRASVKCTLPDLSVLYNCDSPDSSIDKLILPDYGYFETFKFKQTLLSLITRQRNCMASTMSACAHLPNFKLSGECVAPSQIVDNLALEGYSTSAVNSYKESLLNVLNNVKDCAISESDHPDVGQLKDIVQEQNLIINNLKANSSNCPKLPSFVTPQSCVSLVDFVENVDVQGHSPSEVFVYKQSLLNVLNKVEECSFRTGTNPPRADANAYGNATMVVHDQPPLYSFAHKCVDLPLPELKVPTDCVLPSQYVENIVVNGYNVSTVQSFKHSLLAVITKLQDCQLEANNNNYHVSNNVEYPGPVSLNGKAGAAAEASVSQTCDGLPKLPSFQNCIAPLEIINRLNLKSFSEWESNLFKNTLLELLQLQQKCCSSKTTRIIEKPVIVRVPVEVPKIIQQIREVPVRVPVLQPPKIIVREVPVPQPPRIVIKQVPVIVPQPPKIITKQIPVPVVLSVK